MYVYIIFCKLFLNILNSLPHKIIQLKVSTLYNYNCNMVMSFNTVLVYINLNVEIDIKFTGTHI